MNRSSIAQIMSSILALVQAGGGWALGNSIVAFLSVIWVVIAFISTIYEGTQEKGQDKGQGG